MLCFLLVELHNGGMLYGRMLYGLGLHGCGWSSKGGCRSQPIPGIMRGSHWRVCGMRGRVLLGVVGCSLRLVLRHLLHRQRGHIMIYWLITVYLCLIGLEQRCLAIFQIYHTVYHRSILIRWGSQYLYLCSKLIVIRMIR